ncbi:ElyC/SanA/YdcF family protein [Bifidobacterium bifidum]|uniref:ElyC/SanA/YdcF family protein n=1 Tax=Bifidobacterium bifidum TaxID=1681 RepID=UPI003CFEDD99
MTTSSSTVPGSCRTVRRPRCCAVFMEDRSTTTMENLRFSKEIMDARSGVQSVPGRRGLAYRCALVTGDYHVF